MTNDKLFIYTHSTGDQIERQMTDEEQAERDTQVAAYQAEEQTKLTEAEAKAAQKAALLDRLGITEEEAKLLLA